MIHICHFSFVACAVSLQDVCHVPALLVAHSIHVDTGGLNTSLSHAHRDARYQPWSHEILLYNGLWTACCGCWPVSRCTCRSVWKLLLV